jgi:hypothetical protein
MGLLAILWKSTDRDKKALLANTFPWPLQNAGPQKGTMKEGLRREEHLAQKTIQTILR